MIYSKKLQTNIPVTVDKQQYIIPDYGTFTKYTVKDGKISVGYVDVKDTNFGINVEFIKNMNPDLYKGFGTIADQLEVEHCLNRGMDRFDIRGEASLNSHALHYLRGKRFMPEKFNEIVKQIIENTPAGQHFDTKFLGNVRMFMPRNLIEKYLEIIKKNPLLK